MPTYCRWCCEIDDGEGHTFCTSIMAATDSHATVDDTAVAFEDLSHEILTDRVARLRGRT